MMNGINSDAVMHSFNNGNQTTVILKDGSKVTYDNDSVWKGTWGEDQPTISYDEKCY